MHVQDVWDLKRLPSTGRRPSAPAAEKSRTAGSPCIVLNSALFFCFVFIKHNIIKYTAIFAPCSTLAASTILRSEAAHNNGEG